ncbi:hypothetical protein, partial [Lactococcus lactis]|uniref:hypothetical protein n=1 Tax=Lactococcus lactis TaxID=1358 RepID=UPI003D13FDDF
KLYSLNASTRFRHAVAARTPVYGPRAKHENLTVFSWTLSKLTNAGLPFDESWRLASRSVPNVDMAARLEEAGGSIYGNREKLSDAVFNSNLFP